MNTIVVEPKPGMTPAQVVAILDRSGLKAGSEVFIRRLKAFDEEAWAGLLVVVLAAIEFVALYAKAKRDQERTLNMAWSNALLEKIFEGVTDVEALELEVERSTGISIHVQDVLSPSPGMELLNAAYDDNEPDISGLQAREPNPDYRA